MAKKTDKNIDKPKELQYSLNGMSIDKFSVNNLKPILDRIQKDDQGKILLHFDVGGSFSIHREHSIIQSVINVNVKTNDFDDTNKFYEVCQMECAFDFLIKNFDSFYNEKDEFILPHRYSITLSSVSYGTLRGTLFAKTQGSPVGNIVMPLLDILKIPRRDLVFYPQ